MDIRTRQYGDVLILAVDGRLEARTASSLSQVINEQIATGFVRLIIDLRHVNYASSAGIQVLIQAAHDARRHGGDLRLAAAQPQVKFILHLAGVAELVKMYTDAVTATASYFQSGA